MLIDIFEDMAASYQGLEDVALYKAANAADDGTCIPDDVLNAGFDCT